MNVPTTLWAPATLLFLGLFLAGCGGALPGPDGSGPAVPPSRPETVDPSLAAASDQFGVGLLQAVYAVRPGENLFLSPASAQVILSLAANGARGETQLEMLGALGYGETPLADVNQGMRDLRGIIGHPGKGVELTAANAIWHQKGLTVAQAFRGVAEQQYGAQVSETSFGDPAAAKAINRWVSDQTRGRIQQLVDRTSEDDRMWLVNALYFKGAWQKPFDADLTYERPFRLPDGSTREVPFMHQTEGFGYLREEGVTVLRLPYGEGDPALYAFMPDEWEGFVAELTPERYADLVSAVGYRRIQLAMPKVKLTDKADLVEPLKAMGMQRAFAPGQADLGGLFEADPDLYISRVFQKTFLEVNEEGTEAAAATGVGVTVTSVPVDPPPVVVLDRPFLLAIRDDRTGVTLFLGAIVDPA